MIKFTWNTEKVFSWILGVKHQSEFEAAKFLLARYLDYAPEDTGYLKGSAIIVRSEGGNEHQVKVTADYSEWVEFGHVMPSGLYIPPNPAMQRALADTAREFPRIVFEVSARTREAEPDFRAGGKSFPLNSGGDFGVSITK